MARVAVMLLAVLSGCSFVFVPGVHAEHPEECNPSRIAPVADLIMGALEFSLAAGLITQTESTTCINSQCETHDVDNSTAGAVVATVAATQLISSALGFIRTGQCRRLRDRVSSPPPQ